MPSHIFTRVGAWEDSAASNRRSEDTARAESSGDEALHAIDYQVYAYLQMARDADALKAVERGEDHAARFPFYRPVGPFGASGGAGALRARAGRLEVGRGAPAEADEGSLRERDHALRARDRSRPFRTGDAAGAEISRLAELREALAAAGEHVLGGSGGDTAAGAAAWAALAAGRRDEALTLMREAADKEDATEKASVSPGPILPARELLGDMLLEVGQPAAALKEYEASHEREPNRFRGWYGAASAAAKAGNAAKAKTYYGKLAALAQRGDERPELRQARQFLAARQP